MALWPREEAKLPANRHVSPAEVPPEVPTVRTLERSRVSNRAARGVSDRREADRLACYDLATSPRASPAATPPARSLVAVPAGVVISSISSLAASLCAPSASSRSSAKARPPAPPASPSTRPPAPTLAARHRGSRSRLSASSTPFAVLFTSSAAPLLRQERALLGGSGG